MRSFDGIDENIKVIRVELSDIGLKVDAYAIIIEHPEIK